ncbi:MAG: polysaccharide pyruvyl transferase family protein [Odoribacter splanchnicus]
MKFKRKISEIHQKYGKAIILMATPVHGNLGDHAIVYAEQCFLKEEVPEGKIVEVSNDKYLISKRAIRKYIFRDDVIIIDGGGNLGTLWPWEDDKISEIIDMYRNNPVVVFPQTCFYDDSEVAAQRLSKNNAIYGHADKLWISLRDRKSYNFCISHFGNVKFLSVPDIVLYLSNRNLVPATERNGVLLCFRKDREKIISTKEEDKLRTFMTEADIPYKETSTVKEYPVDRNTRKGELQNLWKEFAGARLVITDRLHAMVFSVITHTPCLAVDNVSRKVSGVYELVSGLQSVKICNNVEEVMRSFDGFYHSESFQGEKRKLLDRYNELKIIVREVCI